jgi:alpha-galactosidase
MLPSMGWEPWNIDHCTVTQDRKWDQAYYVKLIHQMQASGLSDLGYKYLTLECYDHYRDPNDGSWQVDRKLFPDGYEYLTTYAHSRGLKIRLYTDAGLSPCGCVNDGGSFGHYEDDAKLWAKWGIDGIKIDWCGGDKENLVSRTQYIEFYQAMKKYIKTPFDIEICCWRYDDPWTWGRFAGSMWRTSSDIDRNVNNNPKICFGGCWAPLMRNLDHNRHPDPNCVGPAKGYNYPDMLLVGHPEGLNEIEERTQFSLWCIMASPLYIGADVFKLPQYAKDILMNKEVIAIDQDPLGIQGDVVHEDETGNLQVWAKTLHDNSVAAALLNRSDTPATITANFTDLHLPDNCLVRDLWQKKNMGTYNTSYSTTVRPHETILIKVTPQNK